LPEVQWNLLDVEDNSSTNALSILEGYDWIVNAIGVIKQFVHDDNPAEVERAIRVNALFPQRLARKAEESGARVLQIATDCVYSGKEGGYAEESPHDPLDVYGKTKSLGEARSDSVFHLRCSIVGPELKNHVSLLDWFLKQPLGAKVTGFTNHRWNGVTTLHFARICQGIIKTDLKLPYLHHVVPTGEITKADMLEEFAKKYGREDIKIVHGAARSAIDRTLCSTNETLNRSIWEAAGFYRPPDVPEMIAEMRGFNFRFASLEI
jgi:dTDP-4-dehydrorhamnose reductase